MASGGIANIISVKRMITNSVQFPKYPASKPRKTPNGTANPNTPTTSPNETLYPKILEIDTNGFWIGFTKWSYQMQLDLFLIFSILPLVIILYYKAKQKIFGAEVVMFLILGALVVGPFVELFTTFYTTFPYRFVPLITFFAIGIGVIFTKKTS